VPRRVSHEAARRALAGLAGLGLLRKIGLGRATRYVSLAFAMTGLDEIVRSVFALM
jgi:hypothetical protein